MTEMTVRAQKVAGGMLALTASAHFLNDMIQSVIPASFPVIKANYALTFAEIALIGAALQLTASVLQPFIGAVCDRKPRPYSLVFGMMLTFTGLILLTRAPNFALLVAATALIGCGSAVFHPEASRAAQTAGAGRKALAQAVFQLGGNAGSAVGPLAAAFVLAAAGQQGIGWFAAAAVLAAILLVGVARAGRSLRTGVKKVSASVASALPESVVRKAFLLLFVLMFSKQIYVSCLTNFLTFFLIEKFSVSVAVSQYVLFGFLAAGAFGTVAGGFLTDRFGRRNVIFWSIFGSAPFALMLPWADFAVTVFLVIAAALVISSAFSAILVCALDLKPGKTGMVSGLFFGLSFGLGGIAAAAFGWLADVTDLKTVFVIASLTPLLGAAALFLPKEAGHDAAVQMQRSR